MIRIEHGPTKIECDDVAQAAQLVNLLIGAPTVATPPPVGEARSKPGRKPRAPKGEGTGHKSPVLAAIVAAIGKEGPEPDLKALAAKLYGSAGSKEVAKLRTNIANSVKRGSLKALASGGWKVAS